MSIPQQNRSDDRDIIRVSSKFDVVVSGFDTAYIESGEHLLELAQCKLNANKDGDEVFVAEFIVLESVGPDGKPSDHAPGDEVVLVCNLRSSFDMGIKECKKFLGKTLACNPKDIDRSTLEQVCGYVPVADSDGNPIPGRFTVDENSQPLKGTQMRCRVDADPVTKKDGTLGKYKPRHWTLIKMAPEIEAAAKAAAGA